MLVVYAHARRDGHCGEILRQLEAKLKEGNQNYELIDLYKISYDPVLSKKQLHVKDKERLSKDTLEFQEKIKKAKNLIFIYPTWWSMPPAILKGFFDRVLTADFAFNYVHGRAVPLLVDKKAVIFTTAGSSWFSEFLQCKPSVKVVQKYVLKFCGIKTKGFLLGSANRLTDENKLRISKMLKKGLKFLT